jgi:hypothetical protein
MILTMLMPFILIIEPQITLVAKLHKIIDTHLTKPLMVATIEMKPLAMGIKPNGSAQVVYMEREYLPIYWFTTNASAIDWM